MPLVAHNDLPTFERLRREGEEILAPDRAARQDIRELHIGFCNVMPDAAFEATERQFLRLIGACNRIAQFYVHPFTLPGIARGTATATHIASYYRDLDQVASDGLDALIITGANIQGPFEEQSFWPHLCDVFDFAATHVTSTLCACLATHAAAKRLYGIERVRLADKLWGIYRHRPTEGSHPITRNINTRLDAPHSRHYSISGDQLESAGLDVLIRGEQADVMLAVSEDGLRFVLVQGHPEYGRESLLKEYKREVAAFAAGDRSGPPPVPHGYFSAVGEAAAHDFVARLTRGGVGIGDFPEARLLSSVDNTWGDTAKVLFSNWLGLVYQLTGHGRHDPLMPGVDAAAPLEGL